MNSKISNILYGIFLMTWSFLAGIGIASIIQEFTPRTKQKQYFTDKPSWVPDEKPTKSFSLKNKKE